MMPAEPACGRKFLAKRGVTVAHNAIQNTDDAGSTGRQAAVLDRSLVQRRMHCAGMMMSEDPTRTKAERTQLGCALGCAAPMTAEYPLASVHWSISLCIPVRPCTGRVRE